GRNVGILPLLGGGLLLTLTPSLPAQAPGGGLNGQLVGNIQGVADLLGTAVQQGAPRNEVNQIDRALEDLLRALRFGRHHRHHKRHHHRHHHGGAFGGGLAQFADAANNPDPNLLNDTPNNPGPTNAPGAGKGGRHPGHGHKGGAFGAGMMQARTAPDNAAPDPGAVSRDRDDRHHHRGAFGGGVRAVRHCRDEDSQGASTGGRGKGSTTAAGTTGTAPSPGKGSFCKGLKTASAAPVTRQGSRTTTADSGSTRPGGKNCVAGTRVGQGGANSPRGRLLTAPGAAAGKVGQQTGGNLVAANGGQGSSKPGPT